MPSSALPQQHVHNSISATACSQQYVHMDSRHRSKGHVNLTCIQDKDKKRRASSTNSIVSLLELINPLEKVYQRELVNQLGKVCPLEISKMRCKQTRVARYLIPQARKPTALLVTELAAAPAGAGTTAATAAGASAPAGVVAIVGEPQLQQA